MNKKSIGAALLLVFVGAVVSVFALHISLTATAMYVAMALGIIGTVGSVAYADPVIGVTAPTAAQASQAQSITAVVTFVDGDTIATITHNWGLTSAQLAKLRPWVTHYYTMGPGVFPQLAFVLGTNTVTINKGSTAGTSGGTLNVVLQRPWSPLSTIDAH